MVTAPAGKRPRLGHAAILPRPAGEQISNCGAWPTLFCAWGVRAGVYFFSRLFHSRWSCARHYGYTRPQWHPATIHISAADSPRRAQRHRRRPALECARSAITCTTKVSGPKVSWSKPKGMPGPLLNLVADEHLERNLRHLSSRLGDLPRRSPPILPAPVARIPGQLLAQHPWARGLQVADTNPARGCLARRHVASAAPVLRDMASWASVSTPLFPGAVSGTGRPHRRPARAMQLALFKGRSGTRQWPHSWRSRASCANNTSLASETSLLDVVLCPDDAFAPTRPNAWRREGTSWRRPAARSEQVPTSADRKSSSGSGGLPA